MIIKCALHVFKKTIKKTITTITALHVVKKTITIYKSQNLNAIFNGTKIINMIKCTLHVFMKTIKKTITALHVVKKTITIYKSQNLNAIFNAHWYKSNKYGLATVMMCHHCGIPPV